MIRTQSEARRLARTQAHVVKSLLIWSWVVDSGKLKGHGPDDGPSHEKTGLVSPDAVGVLYSVGFVSGPGVEPPAAGAGGGEGGGGVRR